MSISVSSLSSLLRSSTAGSTIKGKPSQNRLDSTDGVWFIYKLGQIHLETTTIKQKGRNSDPVFIYRTHTLAHDLQHSWECPDKCSSILANLLQMSLSY